MDKLSLTYVVLVFLVGALLGAIAGFWTTTILVICLLILTYALRLKSSQEPTVATDATQSA